MKMNKRVKVIRKVLGMVMIASICIGVIALCERPSGISWPWIQVSIEATLVAGLCLIGLRVLYRKQEQYVQAKKEE
jgi:hypothetical protein